VTKVIAVPRSICDQFRRSDSCRPVYPLIISGRADRTVELWSVLNRVLISISIALGAMALVWRVVPAPAEPPGQRPEIFDARLSSVQSLDQAENLIRERMLPAQPTQAQIADAIARFVRLRSYHGYSQFRATDQNWLGGVLGPLWSGFAVPVRPDDILKYRRAMCSQQMLVFTALARRFGLHTSAFWYWGPTPHVVPLAQVDGRWSYFDTDLEVRREGLLPLATVVHGKQLARLYADPQRDQSANVGAVLQQTVNRGEFSISPVDSDPAWRGEAVEWTVLFFSQWVADPVADHRGAQRAADRRQDRSAACRKALGWNSGARARRVT
jgi:hypothetical protein